MSNVYQFTPKAPQRHIMTDGERESVVRTLNARAHEAFFPLNRLFTRFAITVNEYPLENPIIKDLEKVGVLMTADYPNFDLTWLFRIEKIRSKTRMPAIPDDQIYGLLRKGAEALGLIPHGVRFAYRYLHELGSVVWCESIIVVEDSIIVDGFVAAHVDVQTGEHLGVEADRTYHPFKMVVRKLPQ